MAAGKTSITADEILGEQLYGVLAKAAGEAAPFPDEGIERKIRAAEDFYERDLQIFLNPTRVASDPSERGLVQSDPAATVPVVGDYDVAEPAYPYDPEMYQGESWGWLELNYRPVRQVSLLTVAFPGMPLDAGFEPPPDWRRLDKKYGRIQLVPGSGITPGSAVFLQMNTWMMSVFAGGRGVPQSIYVDYVSGYTPAELARDFNDLLEGIRLRTVMLLYGILGNIRGAVQSHSLSFDGLTQSESFISGKYGPYSGAVQLAIDQEKEIRSSFRMSEKGIPLMVI